LLFACFAPDEGEQMTDNGRDDRIYQEASALWRELYREPPPIRADGGMMLDIITRTLPVEGYDRLRVPHLRERDVTLPRGPEA
jgi:hypothetical protein